MALTESATHGLSFGEQCELVVQQIEAARFLISKRWIALSPFSSAHEKARSAEPVVKQGERLSAVRPACFRTRKTKVPKAEAFGWMTKECHPWAATGVGPSSKPPLHQQSHSTVSWLGSISSGTHPGTKGARFFTAGTGTEYRRPRRVSWRLARRGARRLF